MMIYVVDDLYFFVIVKLMIMCIMNRNMKFGENFMRSELIVNNMVVMIMVGLCLNLLLILFRISLFSYCVMKVVDINVVFCIRVRLKVVLIFGSVKVMSMKL